MEKREEVGRLQECISPACNRWDYNTDLGAVGTVLECRGWVDFKVDSMFTIHTTEMDFHQFD